MAYWCDDRNSLIEQRRLDAAQEDARRKIEAEIARIRDLPKSLRLPEEQKWFETYPSQKRS